MDGGALANSFKDLIVWQWAVELNVAVYKLTASFPEAERFGLTNQLRRAAVSIASNIAEGYGRSSRGEYVQFLGYARGSVSELQTQLVISEALQMGRSEERSRAQSLSEEVSRMLIAMMKKLNSSLHPA
jgi:four helix bundle protein